MVTALITRPIISTVTRPCLHSGRTRCSRPLTMLLLIIKTCLSCTATKQLAFVTMRSRGRCTRLASARRALTTGTVTAVVAKPLQNGFTSMCCSDRICDARVHTRGGKKNRRTYVCWCGDIRIPSKTKITRRFWHKMEGTKSRLTAREQQSSQRHYKYKHKCVSKVAQQR